MSTSIRTNLDLSRFPAPDAIETLDYEKNYDEVVADFKALWEAKRIDKPHLPDFNTLNLESEVLAIIFQAWVSRETKMRARVNSAFLARLLAYGRGADLDHIGANYGVKRMVVTQATEQAAAVMESDERFRQRINLGIYAYNSAGSIESYQYHAMSADVTIKDVAVDNPHTNRIDLTILSSVGDGTATGQQLANVADALSPKDARPLTDDVRVRSASIFVQPVALRVVLPSGPAPEPVRLLAQQKVAAYCALRHKIGSALRMDGIIGAARGAGDMEQVLIDAPMADIVPGIQGAVFVPSVTATTEILT